MTTHVRSYILYICPAFHNSLFNSFLYFSCFFRDIWRQVQGWEHTRRLLLYADSCLTRRSHDP